MRSVTEGASPVLEPESRSEAAYRAIEEMVVTLQLPPGTVTTEQKLCERTGLGRTPVREALLRLSHGFLVTILPRRGVLVRPVEVDYILMTIDIRQSVERLMVRRAAQLADDFQRRRLRDLAALIEEAAHAPDPLRFMRIDDAFNRLLAKAAQHEVAARTFEPLHCVNRRAGFVYAGAEGKGLAETGREHVRIMHAIAAGNAAEAEAALDALLAKSIEIAHELSASQARELVP
ncbi:GntR family transcriptional regulator [Chelativorans sp. M5D2P16]|uniref:GntR family transcriptional regulator n=1 Tax=Chelativorans sp. M5D2P16 TaxID=3095678 RepID=UPI002ACA6924|nr:GntR family transcriptional regulator [Chelativorans sp. M5D2P16]MDZ5696575.1 GntR family transcriptional regulator [Chelativorans sp. M5D2P16]